MRLLILPLSLPLLLACRPKEVETPVDSEADSAPETAAWNYLVYMDGDNNLEDYVTHDLNELEAGGAGARINVLVLADRIEGYASDDGDWTGSRYYQILADGDDEVVSSPVIEDLGEVDMAAPETLAAFLDWASTNYPAEHTALVMWDHGSGWELTGSTTSTEAYGPPAPPSIAEDDTSGGGTMSIAEGELAQGLEDWVTAHGRLDLIGFDACNMASWEVAYSLVPYAKTMAAAETTVGWEGYRYDQTLQALSADTSMSAPDLADLMVRTEVEGGEWSASAIDLDKVDALAEQVDALALTLMALDDGGQFAWNQRGDMEGADEVWGWYFMDLGSLLGVVSNHSDDVATSAGAVSAALNDALISNYTNAPYESLSGLSIFFDPRNAEWADLYAHGEGATWSADTHWDDFVLDIDTSGGMSAR